MSRGSVRGRGGAVRHATGENDGETLQITARCFEFLAKALRNLFLFTCLGLALGLWGLWSYLTVELERIEPARKVMMALEELPVLLWFLWYVAKHTLLRRPFRTWSCAAEGLPREWWFAVVSIVVALGFKAHTAYSLLREEGVGLERAVLAEGEVIHIRRRVRQGAFIYVYQGRFKDKDGVAHEFFHSANERHQRGWLQPLSQQTRQALKAGNVPFPVTMAYDPELPTRNWVEGIEDDQWRLYNFLGYTVAIQLVVTFAFAAFLADYLRRHQQVPACYDLHMVLPLLVDAVCLCFAGFMVGVFNPLLDVVFAS